ncbi:antitoxin of toxin-antitoxin stability system [Salmonella enterica]|nr:antitoxin of toxin-antitoxin stability system [Salmonella enterica]EBY0805257.1 antitoxin of toxin-antitoxin stability system [Salmonella enterica subsp. enterica serovar Berlin]EHT5010700.1 antitoxin of toxin-antitoxin stability system [Salmonella enterica]EIN0009759.1 antitoxin of toxin-antitoxin stability system [Salmonella enterica]HAK4967346.1 antitoxin of toxin-antitoxin stability system [Salmonella enterica]
MSRVISTTVYLSDELSESAREKARTWYCEEGGLEYEWYDAVYEDFTLICNILGVRLKTRTFTTTGGRFHEKACIWFSGFCCQGDGACFEGHYRYQPQAARNIRDHAPQDEELHRIADELQAIQQRHFWQLQADIQHRGRYYHAHTMNITVTRHNVAAQDVTEDAEHALSEALYDLAHWLYCQLENEYDWLTSPEAVDEALIAGGYTFTETGQRFG